VHPAGHSSQEIYINRLENTGSEPTLLDNIIRLNPGRGLSNRDCSGRCSSTGCRRSGPDVVVGKYFGMNETCIVARATVGA